jgi:ATP-dependent Clp protease ATP-binding subunit ClpA
VGHHVQQSLNGREPADLVGMAAPTELRMEELAVVVTDSKEKKEAAWRQQAKELGPFASPLGYTATRRGLSRAWGRDSEVEQLRQVLEETRANVLLVGERALARPVSWSMQSAKLSRNPNDVSGRLVY